MANKYLNYTGLDTLVKEIKKRFAPISLNDKVDALTQALVFKGVATSADDLNTATAKVGDVYIASPKSGTFSVGGQYVESGDMIIAQAVTSTSPVSVTWAVVQANINGAVTATSDLTAEHVIVGSGRKTVKGLTPSTGYLYWNGTKHVYQTPSAYSLPLAANGTRGGIQIGYAESGRNYAVKLDREKAYVTVPWDDVNITTVENGVSKTKTGNTVTFAISKVENAENANTAKSASVATGYDITTGLLTQTVKFETKFGNIDDSVTDIKSRLDNVESQLGALPSFEAITNTEIETLFGDK